MNSLTHTFAVAFEALTGFSPLPWQRRLYDKLMADQWPDLLDIPTGLGKTSVMAIWLIALADGGPVPRRLVYVVDRRTIVDQATDVAQEIYGRLDAPDVNEHTAVLKALRGQLEKLACDDSDFLSISTLRGGLADDGRWQLNPARAAIIVGTVDMIGSRLLFNPYRAGHYSAASHAGLLGHDSLLVHDEAHLSPSFSRLLEWIIKKQQPESGDTPGEQIFSPRPMKVMNMSATSGAGDSEKNALELDDEDRSHPHVQACIHANKVLTIHPPSKDIAAQCAQLARENAGQQDRVIVYVRSPDTARKVVRQLTTCSDGVPAEHVQLLTGTIRGYERDQMVKRDVVRSLLTQNQTGHPVYLVSTSAGEVGANFDADHLVCDATTLDSFIQRFGRVNRRPVLGRQSRIDIVDDSHSSKLKKPWPVKAIQKAIELLNTLPTLDQGKDASPETLKRLAAHPEYDQANEDAPHWPTPHDVVLDAWSLTSIHDKWPLDHPRMVYLHGEEDNLPQTAVAWRSELDGFNTLNSGITANLQTSLSTLFEHHRIHPIERVTDKPAHVTDLLEAMAQAHIKKQAASENTLPSPWYVVQKAGKITFEQLNKIEERWRVERRLANATIILPCSQGGLNDQGMIDLTAIKTPAKDVADQQGRWRGRVIVDYDSDNETSWKYKVVGGDGDAIPVESIRSKVRSTLLAEVRPETNGKKMPSRISEVINLDKNDDGEPSRQLFLLRPVLSKNDATVLLVDHNKAMSKRVAAFAQEVLPKAWSADRFNITVDVFTMAGKIHDSGKDRVCSQKAMGNPNPNDRTLKIAKSSGKSVFNWRLLDGYRHEYGSLIDALNSDGPSSFTGEYLDLYYHLPCTHHGRGRPHFPKGDFDPDDPNATQPDPFTPVAIARRFDRLQRRYGHWGLAWLESIFRAADAAVSNAAANGSTSTEDVPEDQQ